MTRMKKEVLDHEIRYTYKVENKNRMSYRVFNRYKCFKDSTGAFGGWDMEHKCYYVTVRYAR